MPTVPQSYSYQHLVRDVSPVLRTIIQMQPTLLGLVSTGVAAKAHKHEWPEDVLVPEQTTLATGVNGVATVLEVASKLPFRKDALMRVEGSDEIIRVTAVSDGADELTVVRGYGGSVASAIAAGAKLIVTSKPQQESSRASHVGDPAQPDMEHNYTEIFDDEAVVTRSMAPVYGLAGESDPVGDALNYQVRRAILRLSRRMNSALIFGRRQVRTPSIPSSMGGLFQFHEGSANNVDAQGAAISTKLFGDAFQRIFESGGARIDTIMCGTVQARNISSLYEGKLQVLREDREVGRVVYRVLSDIPIPNFNGEIVVEQNFPSTKISLFERGRITLVPFRAMFDEASRAPGDDFEARRIIGEYTAKFENWGETAGLIENLSDQVVAA